MASKVGRILITYKTAIPLLFHLRMFSGLKASPVALVVNPAGLLKRHFLALTQYHQRLLPFLTTKGINLNHTILPPFRDPCAPLGRCKSLGQIFEDFHRDSKQRVAASRIKLNSPSIWGIRMLFPEVLRELGGHCDPSVVGLGGLTLQVFVRRRETGHTSILRALRALFSKSRTIRAADGLSYANASPSDCGPYRILSHFATLATEPGPKREIVEGGSRIRNADGACKKRAISWGKFLFSGGFPSHLSVSLSVISIFCILPNFFCVRLLSPTPRGMCLGSISDFVFL